MAKRPLPGATKTRLVPPLTEMQAADLYACFLRDTLELTRAVPGAKPVIAYAPNTTESAAYFEEAASEFERVPQKGGTLGARLDSVLSYHLAVGHDQVVAINSDSPTLPAVYLREAFQRLEDPATDVVLGPCDDGGYYLIGWKQRHARLVREVRMSTARVLDDTLSLASEEQLSVALLPSWYDVDDAYDLLRLQRDLARSIAGATHTRAYLHRTGLLRTMAKLGKNEA